MVGQASSLSIKMTGKMPVPPSNPPSWRLLRSARNDNIWPLVTEGIRVYVFRIGQSGDSWIALPILHVIKRTIGPVPLVLISDKVFGYQFVP